MLIDAPIVAVTAPRQQAHITRRRRTDAGEAARDDLGRLERVVGIPSGGRWEAGLHCRVEHPRGATVIGRG